MFPILQGTIQVQSANSSNSEDMFEICYLSQGIKKVIAYGSEEYCTSELDNITNAIVENQKVYIIL